MRICHYIALIIGLLCIGLTSIAQIIDPESDVILDLPFNGNAQDVSGNNNHGNIFGPTLVQDRYGNPNSAYKFDGMNDYIQVPYSDIFDLGTLDFALSLWLQTSQSGSPGMIFQKGGKHSILIPQFWLRTNDKVFNRELVFLTGDGSPPSPMTYADTSNITDGEWHHIVAQRKDNTLEIYIDSELVGRSSSTNRNINDNIGIIIGAQHPNYDRNYIHFHYEGCIDDILLYSSRVLNECEIDALYSGQEYIER